MRLELWPEVEPLLEEALALPVEHRETFLEERSGERPEICEAVQRLLSSEEEVETFLERPVLELLRPSGSPDAPDLGDRLGPYRLVEVLGAGGMGTVYLGRREDQAFEATVAVKILRHGLNAGSFRQRFHQERQILASLQHPRIARLLDGGTTPDGRPYLVLELVRGMPIDEFCTAHDTSVEDRLRLMIQVCEAVDHAHRNLLVHRDLKPNNILVGEDGEAKLLDFGIAKILEEGAQGVAGEMTGTLFRPMTLPYASPEQVRGEAVTTASDTYSLGVILYRLLAGTSPYRLEDTTRQELERAIREQNPRPVSEATVRSWPRSLRGDLDTILAKALRKEADRRYGGARDLGEDLTRVLEHRPIAARPDSRTYRFQKLLRRNPLASGAIASVAGLLLLFGIVSTVQARRIARERDAALEARREAQQVTGFLVDLLKSGSPEEAGSRLGLTVREVVQRSAERLEDFNEKPALKAQVAGTLSGVFLDLDLLEEAGPVVREALELRRRLFKPPHPALAESLSSMGKWLSLMGDLTAAQRYQEQALAMWKELGGESSLPVAENLNELALVYYDQGRFQEAAPLLRRALEILHERPEAEPTDFAEANNNLAFNLHAMGEYPEAETHYRRALELWTASGMNPHPFLAAVMNNLASVLQEEGKLTEAERLFRQSIAMRRELFGESHVRVSAPINKLGWMLMYSGRLSEAEDLFEEALKLRVIHFGPEHPRVAFSRLARARLFLEQGKPRVAQEEARRARRQLAETLVESHWRRRIGDLVLGGALLRQGRLSEAEPLLQGAYEDLEKSIGAAEPRTRDALALLIELHEARGESDIAAELRRKVLPPAGAGVSG